MSDAVPVNVPCPPELGDDVCGRVADANQHLGGLFDVLTRLGVQGRYCKDTIDKFVNEIQPIVDAMQAENVALKAENGNLKKQVARVRQTVAANYAAMVEEAAKRQEDLETKLVEEREKLKKGRNVYHELKGRHEKLKEDCAQYTQHFESMQSELHQLRTESNRLQNYQEICTQQVTGLENELALRRQAAIIMDGIVQSFFPHRMAAHMGYVRQYEERLKPETVKFFEDAFKMHKMAMGMEPLNDNVIAVILKHMNLKADGKLTDLLGDAGFLTQFYRFLARKIDVFDSQSGYR
jgi:regulator of replication initiation timing